MLAGERPTLPIAWAELEQRAREALDERAIASLDALPQIVAPCAIRWGSC
jgi:hypothetical protein